MSRSMPPTQPLPAHHDAALAAFRTAVAGGEDIGEVIAIALARLAVELGSSAALFNRPGSWECSIVRMLISGTVGADDEGLDAYRSQS